MVRFASDDDTIYVCCGVFQVLIPGGPLDGKCGRITGMLVRYR